MTGPAIDGLSDFVEVGRGGFAVVYRAEDRPHARTVAVKVIKENLDEHGIARFERECRAAGSLSGHPNIVSFHGSGFTAGGEPFLVMDHLPGGSLAARVAAHGPLTPQEAIELGVGLAGALSAAHGRGVIHRDLKPENVLYSTFGVAQLVDFGIARMVSEFETRTGAISASLVHAPPEVIAGALPSPQADLYSLGSVLHFALSGAAPFWLPGEESLAPLIARITTAVPPDLRTHGVPDELAMVIEGALSKDPSSRPPSAQVLGEALRSAAVSLGLPVPTLVVAAPEAGPGSYVAWEQTPRRPSEGAEGAATISVGGDGDGDGRTASRLRRVAVVVVLAVVSVAATWVLVRGEDGSAQTGGAAPEGRTPPSDPAQSGRPDSGLLPGPPTDVVVSAPTYLGDENHRVSVTIRWAAPAGEAEVTGYRVRSQQRWREPCDGPGGEEDVTVEAAPIDVRIDPTTETSQYSDTEKGCGWVLWEVAAVSAAGVGEYAPAEGIVPEVRGAAGSFHLVRAVGGLASGADSSGCGEATNIGCSTSPSAGTRIAPGTLVAVSIQP